MNNTKPDYVGMDNFVWWHGVVEDIDDPLKLGRLRVRILGWNTENKSIIPTSSLPWAMVLQPITDAAMSGLGRSPTGILQGAWVIGFFLDGRNAQQPLVIGSYGGIQKPDKPASEQACPYDDVGKARKKNNFMNYGLGFRDPDQIYPVEGRLNEPDTNRLVRNENVDWTIVQKKDDTRIESCDTALYGSWEEPVSPYAAKYPKNHVTESESGHIIEMDDTPNAERLHVYHKSGSFTEIHPKGSEVHKVVGNAWDITLGDNMILVRGNSTETVGKNMKIKVGQNLEIETDGDMRVLVRGSTVMETLGSMIHKVHGKMTFASEGNMLLVAPRIDLNPQGSSAKSITTILTTLRGLVSKVFNKKKEKAKSPPPPPQKQVVTQDTQGKNVVTNSPQASLPAPDTKTAPKANTKPQSPATHTPTPANVKTRSASEIMQELYEDALSDYYDAESANETDRKKAAQFKATELEKNLQQVKSAEASGKPYKVDYITNSDGSVTETLKIGNNVFTNTTKG